MGAVFKGLIASAVLAGSSVAATAPAQADRTGTAIIAGIIGLGVGAAIASDKHRDRYNGYDDYAYDAGPSGYYTSAPSYYGSAYVQPYSSGSYGYDHRYSRGDRYGNDRGYYGSDRHDRDRRDRNDRRW